MLDSVIGIIAPHLCVSCGAEGALLCAWCKPDALVSLPDRCYRCNAVSRDSAVCQKCRKTSPLTHVWIRTNYKDTAKEVIYRLKFARAKAAANVIAECMEEQIPYLPTDTVITYVPTATSRVRLRGYDQSRLIARAIAKRRGLKCSALLMRVGQTRQVGSDRKHRIMQATKNYQLRKNKPLPIKHVLIIDDILTTGASLESAAKLLKQAGVKRVSAAVFAKKQ